MKTRVAQNINVLDAHFGNFGAVQISRQGFAIRLARKAIGTRAEHQIRLKQLPVAGLAAAAPDAIAEMASFSGASET